MLRAVCQSDNKVFFFWHSSTNLGSKYRGGKEPGRSRKLTVPHRSILPPRPPPRSSDDLSFFILLQNFGAYPLIGSKFSPGATTTTMVMMTTTTTTTPWCRSWPWIARAAAPAVVICIAGSNFLIVQRRSRNCLWHQDIKVNRESKDGWIFYFTGILSSSFVRIQ